ncbi:MAG: aminotransferase class I/II-fold pyridoxal phosphate-dependent enzyme [Gemmatimonadales bacterium]|nr:aminotransferase class I/II-fold pyridoxal phosphate-dependent enzyme [Gemmatimonadales bacterium]
MTPDATALPTTDSFTPALERELDVLRRAGLHRTVRQVERVCGPEVIADGRAAIDFSSSDYLGLAADARVAGAVAAALGRGVTGAAAARSIAGNHPLHEGLEAELARLKGTEGALLFPSGYMANAGAIPALAGRGDVIYSDGGSWWKGSTRWMATSSRSIGWSLSPARREPRSTSTTPTGPGSWAPLEPGQPSTGA